MELLKEWDLFGSTMNILQDCNEVHFFNNGKSAFIVKDNLLYAYGDNHPCISKDKKEKGFTIPFKVMDLTCGISALSTGSEHVALLDGEGKVFSWGSNDQGQLGDGRCHRRLHPYHLFDLPLMMKQISCGQTYTLALDIQDGVWFWGRMSTSEKFQDVRTPKRLTLPANTNIVHISCGSSFAAILTSTNKVMTWGCNECGQLGQGHRDPVYEPRMICGLGNVNGVLCASNSLIMLLNDGRIFVAGRTGQTINYATPKEVKFDYKIETIAACWRLDQFGVKDVNGEIYQWGYHAKTGVPQETAFKCVQQVFSNKCIPNVFPKETDDLVSSGNGLIKSNIHSTNQQAKNSSPTRKKQNTNPSQPAATTSSYIDNWCDLKIKLSDGYFPIHSRIVCEGSIFLRAMVVCNKKKEIDLTDFDAATCRTFFKYLYTNKLGDISANNVPQLFQISDGGSGMVPLRMKCIEIWEKALTKKNVLSLYQLAFKHNAEPLKIRCIPVFSRYIEELMSTEEFKNLSSEMKLSLVSQFHELAAQFMLRNFIIEN